MIYYKHRLGDLIDFFLVVSSIFNDFVTCNFSLFEVGSPAVEIIFVVFFFQCKCTHTDTNILDNSY